MCCAKPFCMSTIELNIIFWAVVSHTKRYKRYTHSVCGMQNGMHTEESESRAPLVAHKLRYRLHCIVPNDKCYVVFVVASRSLSAHNVPIWAAHGLNVYVVQSAKSLFAGCSTNAYTHTEQTLLQRCKCRFFASGSMRHTHKSNCLLPPTSIHSRAACLCLPLGILTTAIANRNLFLPLPFQMTAAAVDGATQVVSHAKGKYSWFLIVFKYTHVEPVQFENAEGKPSAHIVLHDFKVRLMQLIDSSQLPLGLCFALFPSLGFSRFTVTYLLVRLCGYARIVRNT